MRDFVESNGGTVSWDESTQTATATLNGHTEHFNINEQTVENGRIIGDDQNLARAFGVNLSSSSSAPADLNSVYYTDRTYTEGYSYGQCTWYCAARAQEVAGRQLDILYMGNAVNGLIPLWIEVLIVVLI